MAEINTLSQSDFTKLANVIFFKGANSVARNIVNSGIVKMVPIPRGTGSSREFSEIDTNEFLNEMGENDQASRGKIQQGYSKVMYVKDFGENMGITYKMRRDNKYPEIIQALLNGGSKGYKSMELDLTHRLTFATSTSYTDRSGATVDTATGDSYALAYSAHTLKGSSTTYRNRVANDPLLSKGGLEAAEKLAVEETYSQLGEKKTATFNILFTGDDPNTVNTAREYLQSTADVTGANAGVTNVYQGKYKHVILPYLATDASGKADTTKRAWWGIASSELSSFFCGVWDEPRMIPPKEGGNGEDVQTDTMEYRYRAAYGIAIPGASFIKMSCPVTS